MQCRRCNVELNEHNTYKSQSSKSSFDKMCKQCRRANNLLVYHLKKCAALPPNGCEICGSSSKLYCDHDHVTKTFRGWVCRECNLALGLLKDDPVLMIKAAKYLNDRRRDSADLGNE